ncbi:MAG: T9SS type A sorting domain-containing protein [Bacteroidales bacterium]|nr:T9SS type A sorting domain-containing protein [Bacteroidales bacterium]
MIRRLILILFIALFLAPGSYSQNTDNDKRLLEIVKQKGEVLVTIPYSDRKSIDILTRNVSILSADGKTINVSLSPITADWFISQKYNYDILFDSGHKGIVSSASLEEAMAWETYPSYTQYDSIMQSFAALYPALCKLETIGTSIYGKKVFAIKISDNVSSDEDEPEVFYSSTMHGDETGGFILMLRLTDYLLKNYNTSSRVKNLVDNLEIWINPLANPDGTYKTGNTMSSPVRYNANGYDLNRNFPDPVTPNTVKQKETIDMIKFMRNHRFVLSCNFHAGKEVVNYPWDRWLSKFHADDIWFRNISRAYADTVHVYSGPAYMNFLDNGVTRGAVWYVVYGGRQDFVTSELQGREVTIELDDIHVTPAAQLSLLWQNNWRSLLGYLENALYGIHGKTINSVTSAGVPAKVFITGHDKDSSHVYSDTLSGSFIRMLSPGSWNLTFSANGYKDTTISDLILQASQRLDLTVEMEPRTSSIDTTTPGSPALYPNPAKSEIKALLHEITTGSVNVRIFNQTGMLLSEFKTFSQPGIPVRIDISKLPAGIYSVVFTNINSRASEHGRFVVIK